MTGHCPSAHEWESPLLLRLCRHRCTHLLVFLFTPGPDGWNNYWSHRLYFIVCRRPAGSCRLAGSRKKHTVTPWNLINCCTAVDLSGNLLEIKCERTTDAQTWWDTTVYEDNKHLKKKTHINACTHAAGRGDTHCQKVTVHPCRQTDKVAIGLGCRLINFTPHTFMGCSFYFCCWGFISGQQ